MEAFIGWYSSTIISTNRSSIYCDNVNNRRSVGTTYVGNMVGMGCAFNVSSCPIFFIPRIYGFGKRIRWSRKRLESSCRTRLDRFCKCPNNKIFCGLVEYSASTCKFISPWRPSNRYFYAHTIIIDGSGVQASPYFDFNHKNADYIDWKKNWGQTVVEERLIAAFSCKRRPTIGTYRLVIYI